MDWINDNAGVLILVFSIALVALLAVTLYLILNLRSKIAVQRLKFLGFYTTELDSRRNMAEIIIGNRSLNDVGIAELGIRNGKTSFNLTELYKEKTGMDREARIVIEQRNLIRFELTTRELKKLLLDGKGGKKILRTMKVYAVDLAGTYYSGRVGAVKKLLHDIEEAERNGEGFAPEPEEASAPIVPTVTVKHKSPFESALDEKRKEQHSKPEPAGEAPAEEPSAEPASEAKDGDGE